MGGSPLWPEAVVSPGAESREQSCRDSEGEVPEIFQ